MRRIQLPKTCEYCGEELSFDGTHLMCTNPDCVGKQFFKFLDAFSRLKILGAGEKMLYDIFMHSDTVHDVFDVFDKDAFSLEAFQNSQVKVTKNLEKVIDKVNAIKEIDLETLLLMTCEVGLGIAASRQIARQIAGLSFDFAGLEKEVVSGYNVGEEKRANVEDIIRRLESYGVKVNYPKEENTSGVTVEFTGSPKPFFKTKEEFLSTIAKYGFKHGAIKDAKILVTDSYESTSSKMKTAAKKGIEVITYEDFVKKYVK